jgi:sterol desaturase/sphingolipid hydroxylase (fatty acid hydroxylase superfamily)
MSVILVLGAPPMAVGIFELVLSSFALLTHANVRLPERLERSARRVFVTPDMHRIHHLVHHLERGANFGFHLTWWDCLFGTYREQPRESQATLLLGLTGFRAAPEQRWHRLLTQPFERSRPP